MNAKRRLYVLDTSVIPPLLGKNETDRARREKLYQLLEDERDAVFAITAPGLVESFETPLPDGIQVLDMTMQAGVIAGRVRRAWYRDLPPTTRRCGCQSPNSHRASRRCQRLCPAEGALRTYRIW